MSGSTSTSEARRLDVAIVGMGAVVPGASDVPTFWDNVVDGRTFFTPMPEDRFATRHFVDDDPKASNKTYTLHGAFVDPNIAFPFADYRVPPNIVRAMDYSQVVALEATRQALADAGLAAGSDPLRDGVVVLGMSGVDSFARSTAVYQRHFVLRTLEEHLAGRGAPPGVLRKIAKQLRSALEERGYRWRSATLALGDVQSTVSNRVAQVFGIGGFNMTTDAACASSFAALEVGAHALLAGDARVAVVGGVDLGVNPSIYIGFARVSGLSRTNESCPFDASANGLMIGEGAGVVIIKRLEDALADGDRIHAVVRGIGAASDGAGKAIYNPDKEGRILCLRRGLKAAGIRPEEVGYLEAHATSTVVGDANEYDCIGEVYGAGRPSPPLQLGSVKHQIGHLKAAAGIAGLIKVVMALRAETIPPMPRFRRLTEHARYDGGGLEIPTSARPWSSSSDGRRVGAVTASGFGGINYHLLVERAVAYSTPRRPPPRSGRVAIVEVACEVPGASDPESLWRNLEAGADQFSDVDPEALGWIDSSPLVDEDERISARRLGQLHGLRIDNLKYRIFPSAVSQIAPTQLLGVDLVGRLYGPPPGPPRDVAVILGAFHNDHFPNIVHRMLVDLYVECLDACEAFEALDADLRDACRTAIRREHRPIHPPVTEHTMPGWMSNCIAGRISKTFNLVGTNYVVDSACSSAIAALMAARYQLMFGEVDEVITGGLNRSTSGPLAAGVATIGAMTEHTPRPFDAHGSGFLLGEGGVVFRVKRLADARRDGETIVAVVHGVAGSSEGKPANMLAPTEAALRRAMAAATRQAGIQPRLLGLVDTHGSANPASDVAEARAVAEQFGATRRHPVRLTSAKAHVGHLYGGAGAVSMLSVIGALRSGVAPGLPGLTTIHPQVEALADRVEVRAKAGPITTTYGGVDSIGLGGANYFAVLSAGDDADPDTTMTPEPAPSPRAPETTEGRMKTYAKTGRDRLEVLTGSGSEPGPVCLAFPFHDDADRDRILRTVETVLRAGGRTDVLRRQGIHLVDRRVVGETLVFALPGQGNQYFGMGRGLYETDAGFRDVVDRVSALAHDATGLDLRSSLYARDDGGLESLAGGQLSIFAIEVALGRWLLRRGVRPSVLVGHSFGEYAALTIAGAWSLDVGTEAVLARIRACETVDGPLGMVSVLCSAPRAAALETLFDGIVLSNRNAPGRYVFAGPAERVDALARAAKAAGLEADVLAVRAAFHTPLMDPARRALRPAIEALPTAPLEFPVFSTATGSLYPSEVSAADIADRLSMQLVNRLDFERDVRAITALGHRCFLEVGPKWSVSTMIEAIVGTGEHHAVPTLHPKAGEDVTVARARAFLIACGRWAEPEDVPSAPEVVEPPLPIAHDALTRQAWEQALSWRSPSQGERVEPPVEGPVPARGLFADRGRAPAPSTSALPEPDGSATVRAALSRLTGIPQAQIQGQSRLDEDLGLDPIQRAELFAQLSTAATRPSELAGFEADTVSQLVAALAAETHPSDTTRGEPERAPLPPPSPRVLALEPRAPSPVPATTAPSSADAATWADRLRAKLVDKTGYPETMLEDGLDLEADLGIDSVQRAEIWAELLAEHGLDPELSPEDASSITQLARVLAEASRCPAPTVPTAPAPVFEPSPPRTTSTTESWVERLRDRLATKTGYPISMLEPGLDLEADLGIDSVQRAEIWAELLGEHGLDPELNPGDAGTIAALAAVLADASGSGTSAPKGPEPAHELGPVPEATDDVFLSVAVPLRHGSRSLDGLRVVGVGPRDEALERALSAAGCTIRWVATADPRLEIGKTEILLYTAHRPLLDGEVPWSRVREAVDELYAFLGRAADSLRRAGAHVLFPVAQDGCFGAHERSMAPRARFGAFPAGLARSLAAEWPECRIQLVDVTERGLARSLLWALGVDSDAMELGFVDGHPVRPALRPADGRATPPALGPDDVVLVTGGGRGIVFECVRALARRRGVRLILTGRTALPDEDFPLAATTEAAIDQAVRNLEMDRVRRDHLPLAEARRWGARLRRQWELDRNLARLRTEGIAHRYVQCDVGRVEAVTELLDRLPPDDRPTAVVHGAGIQRSARLEKLRPTDIDSVLRTKLAPVLALAAHPSSRDLGLLVCFGSVAGVFGNAGQTDYGLANDMMAWAARAVGARRCITVHWTAWSETGMVKARELERFATMGVDVLDIGRGTARFMELLDGRAADAADAVVSRLGALATARIVDAAFPASHVRTTDHGLELRLDPRRDPFLDQHHVRGRPVLPGTFIVDLFRHAAGPSRVLRELEFRRPVWVREADERFEVRREGERLMLVPPRYTEVPPEARLNLVYASCVVDGQARPAATSRPVPIPSSSDDASASFYRRLDARFADLLRTGPIFRGVRSTGTDGNVVSGTIESSEAGRRVTGERVGFDPLLGDMAVQVLASWALQHFDGIYIPHAIAEFRVGRVPCAARCRVACTVRRADEREVVADVVVTDLDGRVTFELAALTLRRLGAS